MYKDEPYEGLRVPLRVLIQKSVTCSIADPASFAPDPDPEPGFQSSETGQDPES